MIDEPKLNSEEEVAKRRFPGIVVYLSPFRIVEDNKFEPWKVSMEEVNFLKWDYAELHRIAGGIEVGLRAPFYLIVCRDGALYLPWIEELRADSKAVEFFNHCLSGLMIGGIYCEAVNSDNLDRASTLDWKYVRTFGPGASLSNTFHFAIRYKYTSPFQAAQLVNPRTVQFQDLKTAMGLGLEVLEKIPTLKGEYLLRGITGFSRRDWGSSLANLWIVVEQILQAIWENQLLKPMSFDDFAKERVAQLRDTRTWTAANRIELLAQKGIIPEECIRNLSIARKARNALSHTGKHPSQDDAKAAYHALSTMMTISLDGQRPPLLDMDLFDHFMTDPFTPHKEAITPTHWLPIPKLPGEEELELAEAKLRSSKSVTEKDAK